MQIEQPPFRAGDLIVNGSKGMIELAAQAVVVFFLALYLLASGDLFKRKLVNLAGPTLSEKKLIVQVLTAIDRQVAAFLLLRLLISASWRRHGLALAAIGLGQSALWGVLAGALNVVPYLGPTVLTIGVTIAAFVQFESIRMALLAAGSPSSWVSSKGTGSRPG